MRRLSAKTLLTASLTSCFLILGSLSLQGCIPAVVAAGSGTAAAGSSQSPLPLGTQVEDITIKTKAVGIINNIPELQHNSNVEIVAFNRIVLILGQVPTDALKNQIANQISQISRVRIVYNQLTIGPNISLSQYAKDSWITAQIGAELIGKVNPMQFKIITENGIVYLIALTNKADGDTAAQVASQVKGVKQVIEAYSYIQDNSGAEVNSGDSADGDDGSNGDDVAIQPTSQSTTT